MQFSLKSAAFDAILKALRCLRDGRGFRGHFTWCRKLKKMGQPERETREDGLGRQLGRRP